MYERGPSNGHSARRTAGPSDSNSRRLLSAIQSESAQEDLMGDARFRTQPMRRLPDYPTGPDTQLSRRNTNDSPNRTDSGTSNRATGRSRQGDGMGYPDPSQIHNGQPFQSNSLAGSVQPQPLASYETIPTSPTSRPAEDYAEGSNMTRSLSKKTPIKAPMGINFSRPARPSLAPDSEERKGQVLARNASRTPISPQDRSGGGPLRTPIVSLQGSGQNTPSYPLSNSSSSQKLYPSSSQDLHVDYPKYTSTTSPMHLGSPHDGIKHGGLRSMQSSSNSSLNTPSLFGNNLSPMPSRPSSPSSVYSSYSYQPTGAAPSSPSAGIPKLQLNSSPLPDSEKMTAASRPSGFSQSQDSNAQSNPKTPMDYLQLGIQLHEKNQLQEAATYFELSATSDGGCEMGKILWGLSLRHGWGVKKDERQAFKWLQKAAENAVNVLEKSEEVDSAVIKNELVLAIYEVAQCFFQGWGVKKDQKMAWKYYLVASRLGDPDAQHDLAFCLANGKGCKKDRRSAAHWYRKSVAQGTSDVGLAWIYKEEFL